MAYRTDRAQLRTDLKPPEKRPDGSTRYHGAVTRSGVFEYQLEDGSKRREYRPPDVVSRKDSLETLHLAPVVAREHTPKGEARKRHVGTVGQDVEWVPSKKEVQASFVVRDDAANDEVAAGMQELSCGYDVDLDETPGTSPEGEPYDAIQCGPLLPDGSRGPIVYEHLAIVPTGRAGASVRLRADSASSRRPSWRTDSAVMTSASAPGGAAASKPTSAAQRGSKDSPAMADKNSKGRNDCGEGGGGAPMEEDKKDAAPPANPDDPAALKAEIDKLKEENAKLKGQVDGAVAAMDSAAAPGAEKPDEKKKEGERMDAVVRVAMANERARLAMLEDAAAVGAEVQHDAAAIDIQRAVLEKLGHKPDQTYRTDSNYIGGMYSMASAQIAKAKAAEMQARGNSWLPPGQRNDSAKAVDPVAEAYKAQQARFEQRAVRK